MSEQQPEFPFTAIVGQEPLKTALVLNAINPRIGGVVISGPRGSAKSTLARGLAAVIPAGEEKAVPFVNLPLSTTEDRLVGSLDLQQVLTHKETAFRPGLFAAADGGVLYVDEVNLLPDNLVDLLLDTAARGVNVVERDGISHSHSARFRLIGTMNPDEGDLRPQLLDRFGLCVELAPTIPREQRVAVIQQCEAFERDPVGYCASVAPQQEALTERIRTAQSLLPNVVADPWVYQYIAEACEAAQVEGLRADVSWHRAAQAHAAWRGGDRIEREDLEAVAEWVLAHRRKRSVEPPDFPPPPPQGPSGAPRAGSSELAGSQALNGRNEQATNASEGSSAQGQWGAMPPMAEETRPLDHDVHGLDGNASPLKRTLSRRMQSAVSDAGNKRKGFQAGRRSHLAGSEKPNWFATLVANRGLWPLTTLRFQKKRAGQPTVHFVLLDTSGSTLGGRLLGQAKGLVQALATLAYGKRDQMAVLGFGNDRVTPLLQRCRAPKSLISRLDALSGGGGTPLREALTRASRLIHQWQNRERGLRVKTYLITDGRTRQSLTGLPPLGDCVVVDVEKGPIKRGRAQQIAQQLGADYLTGAAMGVKA
ncbi:AAA family ATPase [Marinimicrobium locisalis]|uniref:AAA family ATPase n=1 Tax=Marinimicrobium locisalis TaxID=546022 RepID=UPI003221F693